MGDVGYGEWRQFVTGELNDHHSVLHTLVYAGIIEFAVSLGFGYIKGVAILTIIQALAISAIFTYILSWMHKGGASKKLLVASFMFFAVNPSISLFVMCTNSDVIFSAIVILLITQLFDVIKTKPEDKPLKKLLGLFATCVLLCLLRPNGLYAFIILSPFLVLLSHKTMRLKLICCCSAVLLSVAAWTGFTTTSLQVEHSYLQDYNALSLPIQQIGAVCDAGVLTQEEVNELIESGWTFPVNYDENLVDPTRKSVTSERMPRENLISSWMSLGLRYPSIYFDALVKQTQDAWNPYSYSDAAIYGSDESLSSFFSPTVQAPATLVSKIPQLYDLLWEYSRMLSVENVPFFALLVSIPLCVYVLLFGIYRALTRNRAALGALLLPALLVCSVLLGPGVIARYYLYLFFGFPLIVFMMIQRPAKSKNK